MLHIKNAYDMLIMRIEYIFIKFLHFMSYKSLEQKTVFLFNKEEAFLQKKRKKHFGFFVLNFIALITCRIFNM
jgi:hypothetical protein